MKNLLSLILFLSGANSFAHEWGVSINDKPAADFYELVKSIDKSELDGEEKSVYDGANWLVYCPYKNQCYIDRLSAMTVVARVGAQVSIHGKLAEMIFNSMKKETELSRPIHEKIPDFGTQYVRTHKDIRCEHYVYSNKANFGTKMEPMTLCGIALYKLTK
jgi:hypothetical protein